VKPVLFVSDVHASPAAPERGDLFVRFLETRAADAGALYLLGDIFDYWVGPLHLRLDDYRPVLDGLRALTASGVPVTFVPGNRDFLLSGATGRALGLAVAPGRATVTLDGQVVRMEHGDLLTTADWRYQAMRAVLRSAPVRRLCLSLPHGMKLRMARRLRTHSERVVKGKSRSTLEAKPRALRRALAQADVLVFGHVHESGRHPVRVGGEAKTAWGLGSWDPDGTYLEYAEGEFRLRDFS
jgi:UDP-2,3-diacylglucosamine hydrolase